jgi:hypothetical protein
MSGKWTWNSDVMSSLTSSNSQSAQPELPDRVVRNRIRCRMQEQSAGSSEMDRGGAGLVADHARDTRSRMNIEFSPPLASLQFAAGVMMNRRLHEWGSNSDGRSRHEAGQDNTGPSPG